MGSATCVMLRRVYVPNASALIFLFFFILLWFVHVTLRTHPFTTLFLDIFCLLLPYVSFRPSVSDLRIDAGESF